MNMKLRIRLAVALLAVAVPVTASASAFDSVPPSGQLTFDVIRNGKDIGDQTISFSRSGDRLTVRLKTDVKVKLPVIGMSVYAFRQDSIETWQGGKLSALKSKTDDNGTQHDISLGATPLVPASLWDAEIVSTGSALNTIDGSTMPISVRRLGHETIAAGGQQVGATHYAIGGGLKRDLWFDGQKRLVHVRFTADDGSTVDYVLR
jgi:Domain of unknown function (DUF6134)